jgi:hypothetical protein
LHLILTHVQLILQRVYAGDICSDRRGIIKCNGPDITIRHYKTLASGLAAVRASENTREAIRDTMKRKEVYATTGTRMTVRVFAGWDVEQSDVQCPDFDPKQRAFYYVRVWEIPTPRWTTYDAAFFGVVLPEGVEPSHQERAYT